MNFEPTDITLEIAEHALSYCNYNDRDEWVAMGMALKSEFGAEAFDVFDGWSANYTGYKVADVTAVWKSFKGRGVGIGTLIDAALKQGFKFEIKEVSAEDRARLNNERDAKMAQRKIEEDAAEKLKNDYRETMKTVLTKSINEQDFFSYTGKSEYLDNKNVGSFGVLYPKRPLIFVNDSEKGLFEIIGGNESFNEFLKLPADKKPVHRIVKSGAIMIPLYDENFNIWNIQVIYNTGTKRFLAGRKQGCFHIIGEVKPVGKLYFAFAEGYANAVSIHLALKCPVVVCFDAGNMLPVTNAIKSMWGDRIESYLFCADDDAHLVKRDKDHDPTKNKGYMKAKAAAALVDGLVVLPLIDPVAAPEDDSDCLYVDAVNFVIEKQKVSISGVQKALRVGYNRAARLVDIMQNKKIVSEQNEAGRRTVLIKNINEILSEVESGNEVEPGNEVEEVSEFEKLMVSHSVAEFEEMSEEGQNND